MTALAPTEMPRTAQPQSSQLFCGTASASCLPCAANRCRTFPSHWAGISGYVEGDDPLDRALVEIYEETGLPRQAVTLRRVGSPLVVEASAHRRQFQVHPFLFSVDVGAALQRDWEAARFEWVDVSEVQRRARTPAVPQLYDAFDRVWPPWPWRQAIEANVELACKWLRGDRQMGAGSLARAAARELSKCARLTEEAPWNEATVALREAAEQLRWVRPSMKASGEFALGCGPGDPTVGWLPRRRGPD